MSTHAQHTLILECDSHSEYTTPTIFGYLHTHHDQSYQHFVSHTKQQHTLMNISPIPNHHFNVYKHTVYDPHHHITLMNETYLYMNNPQIHSAQFATTQI